MVECKSAAERIRAKLSNHSAEADRANIAVLETVASGLSKFADSIDDDIGEPQSDTSFQKAAEIAAGVYEKAKAFLEQHPTVAVTATFCFALAFLHGVGIDDYAASFGLAHLLKSRRAKQKTSKQEAPKQTKAKKKP